MAACDYRLCDVCDKKAFYDSNLNYDFDNPCPTTGEYPLENVGKMVVICKDCVDTFDVVLYVRRKQLSST